MSDPIQIEELTLLASNSHWRFCVGRVGGRWLGFALGDLEDGQQFMNVFHQVAQGCELGLPDRDEAIRLTTAIAWDPNSDFGRVNEWYCLAEMRGDPEDYRCPTCEEVGCKEDHADDYIEIDYPHEVGGAS